MSSGKGEDEGGGKGGWALAMWVSCWCITLVVVMNLLWHIRCRDRVPPAGVTGESPALIGGDTCPGKL